MSELTREQFERADYEFLKRAVLFDLGCEDWDVINFVRKRSWLIGLAAAYIPLQKTFLEALPHEAAITRTLRRLRQWDLLLMDGHDDLYYFNLAFTWFAPLRKNKGKRRMRNDNAPLETPLELEYGALPEGKAFLREFFLAKIGGKLTRIFDFSRAETGSPLIVGRKPGDDGTSPGPGIQLPDRAAAPPSGSAEVPPLPGARSISDRWTDLIEAVSAGKMTLEEAKARVLAQSPTVEKVNRAADHPVKIIATPSSSQTKSAISIPVASPEKQQAAWLWLVKMDKRGRLGDLRCGVQWQSLCQRDPAYVLNDLPELWSRAVERRAVEGKPAPPDPIAYLSLKALDAKKLFPLYSMRMDAVLTQNMRGGGGLDVLSSS